MGKLDRLRSLFQNRMLMMVLATAGKPGKIAASVIGGLDTVFESIKQKRAGEITYADLILEGGEVIAETAKLADINVIDDKLKGTFGAGTVESINHLQNLRAQTKNPSEGDKIKSRLAAAKAVKAVGEPALTEDLNAEALGLEPDD